MIIVDFSQVVISHLMAEIQGSKDVEINVPLLRHMVLNALRSFKVKFGAEYGQMVIATDSSKGYWRKKVFKHYKASRKKSRADSGLNWKDIFTALDAIRQELGEFFPYPVIEVAGAEADDVIAALVEWTQTNDFGGSVLFDDEPQAVLILSGDGDFEQLQRYPNVRQYSPIHKKWIKAEGSPDEVVMEHILSGDKSDGVPNFLSADETFVTPGLRQKSLMKANLALWRTQKPKDFIEPDSDLMKNYERNRTLIDLRCTPQDLKDEIVEQYVLQKNKPRDRGRILTYFMANRMKGLLEHIQEF